MSMTLGISLSLVSMTYRSLIAFLVLDLELDTAVAVLGLASGAESSRLHRRKRAFHDFPEISGVDRIAFSLLAEIPDWSANEKVMRARIGQWLSIIATTTKNDKRNDNNGINGNDKNYKDDHNSKI